MLPGYDQPGKVNVMRTTTIAVNYGGDSDWTSTDVDILRTNATFERESTIGFDTTNALVGATYDSSITGEICLRKIGANELDLGGENTFTGNTSVHGGILTRPVLTPCKIANSTTAITEVR